MFVLNRTAWKNTFQGRGVQVILSYSQSIQGYRVYFIGNADARVSWNSFILFVSATLYIVS